MHSYKNILDGAKGLLVETISAIESTDLEYLIVGGWSPYLRNKTNLTHPGTKDVRSEEHTSELQSRENLVCRLLLEKKKIEYCSKSGKHCRYRRTTKATQG